METNTCILENKAIAEEKKFLRKKVINLALPVILENLLQTVLGFVDMAFIGHLGAIQLAGVGLANHITFILIAILVSLNIGTTVLVSQNLGAKRKKVAQDAVFQASYAGAALSFIVFVFGLFFSYKIFYLFPNASELVEFAGDYFFWIITPSFALIYTFIFSSALRGSGDTKTPLKIAIFVNSLNIILDYILIFGFLFIPALGVKGAAIATTISRTIGVILLLRALQNVKKPFYLPKKLFPFNKELLKKLLKIGIPTSIERLIFTIGALIFSSIVLSLGAKTFAAHRIALNVESLSFNPGFGFAIATTTLVGLSVGENNFRKAKISAYESLKTTMTVMGIIGMFLFIFAKFFVLIFTKDQAVINQSVNAIKIIALIQPFLGAAFVMEGALRGGGNTRIPLFITALGTWIVRIPLGFLFVKYLNLGIEGAWYAMSIDIMFKSLLNFFNFSKRKAFISHVSKIEKEVDELENEEEIAVKEEVLLS